ncbi:UvrB/UvrC motif-containing protein [Treponema denticola]|uniref:UvrB/UvrC motif-containing protein n=1 Tax=Treponema denticola TaxID=158 RepID=UPI00210534A8|nr:UvrB/UvrC motif-containing protein [Treponema denticola]
MRILSQKKENLQYSGSVPDIPPASFTEKQSAAELRQKLIQAVEIEDYETAAALRDELKALEKNHGSKF